MARARTMPRHTAAPASEGENSPDLRDGPDLIDPDLIDPDLIDPDLTGPDLIDPDLTGPDLTEHADRHEEADRQGGAEAESGSAQPDTAVVSGADANGAEQPSLVEKRSVLDALWSAVVAAPTSRLPPNAGPQAPASTAPDTPAGLATPAAPAAEPTAPEETEAAPPTAASATPITTLPEAEARSAPPLATDVPAATNRTIWAGPRHAAPHDWTSTSALLTAETPAAVADAGLLVLRLVVGLTMAAHGAQKAFGAFGGDGLSTTAEGFSALGYQPGLLFALAAVVGELFGGLLLAIGLLTPLAAGGIIGVTVNAMVAVNLGNGFFASGNGIELPLVLSGGALALLVAGPGRYAADARIPFFNGAAVQSVAAGIALVAMLASLGAHLM